MTDRLVNSRSIARIVFLANTVVVLSQMKTQVKRWNRAHRLMEALAHNWGAYLMNNYVESQLLSQRCNFNLTAPDAVFSHFSDVIVNRLVIFNVELVLILILCYLFNCSQTQPLVI